MWTKILELNHILSELHYYIVIYSVMSNTVFKFLNQHQFPSQNNPSIYTTLIKWSSQKTDDLPRRPDDTGNTANKRSKVADRRPKQNQAGPSRASHAASDSHFSEADAGQNIRQNTDTAHPAHSDSNVRASNIDIQVGTFQRHPAVSTDQFPSHLVDIYSDPWEAQVSPSWL